MPGNECDIECHLRSQICGNGITELDIGEQCDNGSVDTVGCNGSSSGPASCRDAVCGDGYVNAAAGEECEANAQCSPGTACTGCNCI
jgi:hypothetical protein